MTKMLAIARRILLQFIYDKRTLLLLFVAPIIVLWLLSVLLGASGYVPKVAVKDLPEEYVTALEKQDGYPPVVMVGVKGLKITKSSFKDALMCAIENNYVST